MGHPDFRVKRGIFATLNADESVGVLRLPLEFAEAFLPTASHVSVMGRQKNALWLGIQLQPAEITETRELIELAHEFRCKK